MESDTNTESSKKKCSKKDELSNRLTDRKLQQTYFFLFLLFFIFTLYSSIRNALILCYPIIPIDGLRDAPIYNVVQFIKAAIEIKRNWTAKFMML